MQRSGGTPYPAEDSPPSQSPAGGPGLTLADHAISAFLHAPIAVAVCEPDGVVARVNDAVTRLLSYPADELVGKDLFRFVEEELLGHAIAACTSLRDGSAETIVHDTRLHTKDGRILDVRVTTSAVRADSTSHPHTIMHLEDTTDRENLRRRLEHEASHDPLTGLSNRARFLDELQRALPRGVRHGQPVTVFYLDLDDFKAVNDTFGHTTGDRLLVAVGQHVRDSIRPEDTAARLGGDEFAVLCEDTSPEEAARIIERLKGGSWTTGLPRSTSGAVTVTVGVATSPVAGRHLGADELLHAADAAMYAAKSHQRH
ncbi:MAG: GGDEF domain-containing protein [Janthinobacterium lividum]